MSDVEAPPPGPLDTTSKEETHDVKSPQQSKSSLRLLASRLSLHFSTNVSTDHADVLLLSCCFISGLVDSTVYDGISLGLLVVVELLTSVLVPAYGTFVSMQTGNTIFVGLGGSQGADASKPYGWAKSLTSIFFFFLGCFLWSRFSRLLGPQQRRTLVWSFFLQTLATFLVAGLVAGGAINGARSTIPNDIDWLQEIPVAILSFQAAGQLAGSRALNLSEIPTVVVTSLIYDFGSDPGLGKSLTQNVKRNRRGLAFLGILVGAVVGGWVSRETDRMESALWIAASVKMLVTVSLVVWPENSG